MGGGGVPLEEAQYYLYAGNVTDGQPQRARDDGHLQGSSRYGNEVPRNVSEKTWSLIAHSPSSIYVTMWTMKKFEKSEVEYVGAPICQCGSPSPMEKADLINAGLGPRKIFLFE